MIWLLALTGWNIGATGNASELTLLLTAPRRGHRAEWEARCPLGEWAPRETHSMSVSDNRPFRLPATLK
jgi:hypothetical protein